MGDTREIVDVDCPCDKCDYPCDSCDPMDI